VNTSQILSRVLKYTGILAVALAVIGGILGYVLAGSDGLISVLLGTVVAVVFAAVTAISLQIAIKFEIAAFFGIVMGAWLLKMVLFIAAILLLRDQPFINPVALFVALVVAIVGTVVIDAYVVMTSRQGYVSDVSLPGSPANDDTV
jgi:hypothetical protein